MEKPWELGQLLSLRRDVLSTEVTDTESFLSLIFFFLGEGGVCVP